MNIIARFKTGSTQAKQRGRKHQITTNGLWHHIKHWFHQRPYGGAFCVLAASLFILWSPICLIQNNIVPPSTLLGALLVGGLLFAMGLIELLAPSYALVAGAIGIVLALISLLTALGGFGIGMLLAVIGSSYAVAWKPESQAGSRLVFWSVFGCSIATASGMILLITNGAIAVAAPIVGPYTTTAGRVECYNSHIIPAISQVDHRTPVLLSHIDYCTASNVVITQHVLGRTIRITGATLTSRGITGEAVATHLDIAHSTNLTTSAANGLEQHIAITIQTNVTSEVLFNHTESATVTDSMATIS